ncbi:protein arginine kinase activator [Peptoniphilus olsenii]|uniref:Protein arginine kinase activator n=1 Tax=Peptoniphilus olsenii TaxID=411570 RepID=A0ABV2J9S6_9FIRM
MLCDICNERESVISYTKINENKVEEVHLCEICAEKKFKMDFATYQDIMPKIEDVLRGILKLGPYYHEDEDIVCEYCNRTFTEFKNTGILGCPHCYKTFEYEFDKYLRALNLKDGYKGKIPKNADEYLVLNRKISELKSKLDIAVSMEEYEKAAQFRDKINELKEEKNV